MPLKEKFEEDLKAALKEKKEIEVSVLRMLKAAIFNKEKVKRYQLSGSEKGLTEEELVEKSQLTDEETEEVVSSEIKKRKETILECEKGERRDLAEKEKKELEILKRYLPEQLSEEEIKKLAKGAVEKIGAKEPKDIGRVMAELMPKVKGKADGALIGKIVKELLTL